MMQVVKSINLRDIHRKWIRNGSYPHFYLAFVARHVERVGIRRRIGG